MIFLETINLVLKLSNKKNKKNIKNGGIFDTKVGGK
jgi:hypothetical protein